MATKKAVELVENKKDRAICETHSRFDVLLYGARVSQLYFNMRGYCGVLPTPTGGRVSIGERSISAYRAEVSKLNREFVEYGKPVQP